MINYEKILNQNMVNVFKNILEEINRKGISNNQLYVTFLTNHKDVKISKWLIDKYPDEMTIVIQYEYYNLEIEEKSFKIILSFNEIKEKLEIGFNAIISFADPSANFGLKLQTLTKKSNENIRMNNNLEKKDNIINFSKFKKN